MTISTDIAPEVLAEIRVWARTGGGTASEQCVYFLHHGEKICRQLEEQAAAVNRFTATADAESISTEHRQELLRPFAAAFCETAKGALNVAGIGEEVLRSIHKARQRNSLGLTSAAVQRLSIQMKGFAERVQSLVTPMTSVN